MCHRFPKKECVLVCLYLVSDLFRLQRELKMCKNIVLKTFINSDKEGRRQSCV